MYSPWTSDRWIFRPSNGLLRVRRSEDLVSFVLCIAVAFVGIMLLAQALEQYKQAKTVASWPTAIGRVTQSSADPVNDAGAGQWRPFVQYTYEVNGRTVLSSGVSLATQRDTYNENTARAMIAAYPPNTGVVVFYNPDNVTDAVIEHALPRFAWQSLIAGLVLLSVGSARLLLAHRVFWR